MATAMVGTTELEFTYNDEGIRTSKTINGLKHTYHLNGTQIVAEEWNGTLIVYLYDAEGNPIGMQYRNTAMGEDEFTEYWYEKNLQGDIVAVYNAAGTKLISYTYDAWGNFIKQYHNGCTSSNPVVNNPFLYRGYYFDNELGMYYLQSRYYDPVIGRWVNADSVIAGANGSLQGYNMYAYCFNNPINMTDGTGAWPSWNDIKSCIGKAVDWVDNNIFQPIVKFVGDVVEDCQNFDSSNQSENKVLQSNYFSSYKGVPVIRTNGNRSGSFGWIFLTRETNYRSNPEDVVRHEYGHTKQLEELGILKFALCIGLPSWQEWGTGPYYSKPWELTADIYGGVQSRNHSPSDIDSAFSYLEASKKIGVLIWLFIK